MNLDFIRKSFSKYRINSLVGRYITYPDIEPIIKNMKQEVTVIDEGKSVLGTSIQSISIGKGTIKILMWSQMHGNESTTTKAVLDMANAFIHSEEPWMMDILECCIIKIVPMLNPDGAQLYTRFNYNKIDLNRDAQQLSQPESRVLRKIYKDFKPDFCFNLHGQRTIFGAGESGNPATLSFLAPAQDPELSITPNRQKAMAIIVDMAKSLNKIIPDSIGIYDDSFNDNCVGDYFQSQGVPTILFEAGHYKNDYAREEVRYFIYFSLLSAIKSISTNSFAAIDFKKYFKIPSNQKNFFDIIIRDARAMNNKMSSVVDIAIQYEELLRDGQINFIPKVEKITDLSKYFGHREIYANGADVLTAENDLLFEGYANDFVLLNNELLSLK